MSMTPMAASGVHYMGGPITNGRNSLARQRRFLRQFELRLQRETSGRDNPILHWVHDRGFARSFERPSAPERLERRQIVESDN